MPNPIPRHSRHPLLRLAAASSAAVVVVAAAACSGSKGDTAAARPDSAVAGDTAEQARQRADSLGAAAPGGPYMPNAKSDTGGVMPKAVPPKERNEPMPTTEPPGLPKKSPPARVVPDPVKPTPPTPLSSIAADSAVRDSLHDSPSDYGAKRPERRRVLPPIKP